MTRTAHDRVRLAPADWGGLCSLALTLVTLVGATLLKVHDMAADARGRQTRFETELGHLKTQVTRLQDDVRLLLRSGGAPRTPG